LVNFTLYIFDYLFSGIGYLIKRWDNYVNK
jgi:hypothetical protein